MRRLVGQYPIARFRSSVRFVGFNNLVGIVGVDKRKLVVVTGLVLGSAVLAVVTFGLLFGVGKPEPTINGVPFSRWIEMGPGAADGTSGVAPAEVMPYLIGALHTRDSALKRFGRGIWSKLPVSIRNRTWKYRPSDPRTVRSNA